MLAASAPSDITQTDRRINPVFKSKIVTSSDAGRSLVQRRWDAYRAAAAAAVANGTGEANSKHGWRAIITRQVEIALSGGRGSTQAAALVGRAIGALDALRQVAEVNESSLPVELQAFTQFIRAQCAEDPSLMDRLARLARGEP